MSMRSGGEKRIDTKQKKGTFERRKKRRRKEGQVVNFRAGISEAAEPSGSAVCLRTFRLKCDPVLDPLMKGWVGVLAA